MQEYKKLKNVFKGMEFLRGSSKGWHWKQQYRSKGKGRKKVLKWVRRY